MPYFGVSSNAVNNVVNKCYQNDKFAKNKAETKSKSVQNRLEHRTAKWSMIHALGFVSCTLINSMHEI